MSSPRDRSPSTVRSLHRLVEHYTPDGTLGRTLLGAPATLLAPVLFFGGIWLVGLGATFISFVMGLLGTVLGIPTFLLGILTLWPVYLSLIGNVESPEEYPEGASKPGDSRESHDKLETPEEVLKRRYAAGELTREEFERRLSEVMDSGGRESAGVASREVESEDGDDRVRSETSASR